jgi:hypothetical protein
MSMTMPRGLHSKLTAISILLSVRLSYTDFIHFNLLFKMILSCGCVLVALGLQKTIFYCFSGAVLLIILLFH